MGSMEEEQMQDLIKAATASADPIGFLLSALKAERMPKQTTLFYSQIITGVAIHSCIVVAIGLSTYARHRNGQLWFTRQQQQKTRLNATVITMLFAALYSVMAIGYSILNLAQQSVGRYLPGMAAFELSCFAAVSYCITVICYTYYQSLPVGFDASFIRRMFGRQHAATDRHLFGLSFLAVWMVLSLAGNMVSPIIYDYWLRQLDSTTVQMIEFLERDDVQAQGLLALGSLSKNSKTLVDEMHNAKDAVRYQILVYLSQACLYLLILVPVGWKLVSLLNAQIRSLHRAADDFFRLGSRLDVTEAPNKTRLNPSKSMVAKYSTSEGANGLRKQVGHPAPILAQGPTTTVTCNNCNNEVAIAVHFETVSKLNHDRAQIRAPQPKPRFRPPDIPLGSDFPLVRAKKLARVRKELIAFSAIVSAGIIAFIAACSVMYIHVPQWDQGEIIRNFYSICLWCYAIPAGACTILYVYLTLTMPRHLASAPSTPDSRATSEKSFRLRVPGRGMLTMGDKPKESAEMPFIPPKVTRRNEPTFPRAPSTAYSGFTTERRTELTDIDEMSDGSTIFVPPPVPSIKRGHSIVRRWVGETQSYQERQESIAVPQPVVIRAPPPSQASLLSPPARRTHASRVRSMAPVSQTQSWLDINEED